MKRYALILSAVLFAGFAGPAFAGEDSVAASTDTKIEWPDYKSKPWVTAEQSPLVVEARIPVKNNSYVLGPGRYDVLVGTVTMFVDSAENPMTAVTEGDVLGKGAVIRMLQMRGIGLLGMQIKVDGKWQDAPPGSQFSIEVMDPKRVVSQGELRGVIIRVMDGDTELMRVVIENKLPAKSKK